MPATRQSTRNTRATTARSSLKDDDCDTTVSTSEVTNSSSSTTTTTTTTTVADELNKKKTRLISERSPAIKSRKKGSNVVVEENKHVTKQTLSSGGVGISQYNVPLDGENKENNVNENDEMTYSTPPRPTPYWKVRVIYVTNCIIYICL